MKICRNRVDRVYRRMTDKRQAEGEPFVPQFKIAVIGVGQQGYAALRQYQNKPHNISKAIVSDLRFCKEPFTGITDELTEIVKSYPILFWLVDLHDISMRTTFRHYMAVHKRYQGNGGLSVCVLYQSQCSPAETELAGTNLAIFVDDRLDSLSLVLETLLDHLSEPGVIGLDMFDIFSVLYLSRTMYYFRRNATGSENFEQMLLDLTRDAGVLLGADRSEKGIVSIRTEENGGLDTTDIERAMEVFKENGYWMNQHTAFQSQSGENASVSLLVGH